MWNWTFLLSKNENKQTKQIEQQKRKLDIKLLFFVFKDFHRQDLPVFF